MNLYQIVGLTKTTGLGTSYQTGDKNYILLDENGKGILKPKLFTKYILYILLEKTYYAIHLSKYDCASFSGKLCYIGMMSVMPCNYAEDSSSITHVPIQPLSVFANFEEKKYDYDDYMDIYLHDEPDIYVFRFSRIGGNELNPFGYVHFNMDLFQPV